MEARIIKEKGDRDVASIKELTLKDCKSTSVTGLTEDWKCLESLNLQNVGLTTLKGFPKLPSLKKLELSKNKLCDGLDALACLPNLEELNLSGNTVKNVDAIKGLAELNNLKNLKLKGNGICRTKNYKEKLFDLIPSLEQIDGVMKPKESAEKNGAPKNEKKGQKGQKQPVKQGEREVVVLSLSDFDDDSDEDDSEDGEEKDSDSDDEGVPLETLYGKINEDEDDDEFQAEEEDEDDEIEEEEDDEDASVNVSQNSSEETEAVRGKKRKHEDEEK